MSYKSEYTATNIVDHLSNVSSDMAHIIGRYKGSMGVFIDQIRDIAKNQVISDHAKFRLELVADNMEATVHHNEKLWDVRGKRTKKSDIVEIERAS